MENSNLYKIKMKIVKNFNHADWLEIGLLTGYGDFIENHPRLLRSLGFEDEDYPSCVTEIINKIYREQPNKIEVITNYIQLNYPEKNTEFISAIRSTRTITFSPSVFDIPMVQQDDNLVSVMMPFNSSFNNIYECIKEACNSVGFNCSRADDIWENSTFIQDIFELIYKSKIVIVDFSTKNPNVMYETGIAHSLGKTVIPITQNLNDIPSDMQHHRALEYLNNSQGLQEMSVKLQWRLENLKNK